VIAALVALFARTVADPDLWGHLRFGQDLLRTGQVIRPDPYSYMTGDQMWIKHEWLAEGIFALTYRAAGSQGLIGLKLLAALSICGLIYACLRDLHLAPLRAWILVLLGTIPIYLGLATVRPHLFTYICFALLFMLWQAERGRFQWLWGLPLLFVLWPNLHGGFLAGVGILLHWLLVHLLELVLRRRVPRARRGGRIVGPLKATAYVVKWSWGYQNYDRPVRISWRHFQFGRVIGKLRLDRGTGLSSRILGEALETAMTLGFLERHGDAKHPTYCRTCGRPPRIQPVS